MKIGNNIRTYRRKAGLNQATLAQLLGYTDRSSIAKIETGKVDISQTKLRQLADIFGVPVEQLLGLTREGAARVPILGTIACGAPILAQEHIESYTELPGGIHADFALICKGDSMAGARIFDGDIVYIRQQDTVENGEIAAVLIDGEATLKRVRYYPDSISLQPENPMYRPIILWGEEMNQLRILGKAVAFTALVV
jgi:repressor LexA